MPGSNTPESECAVPNPATVACHPSPSLMPHTRRVTQKHQQRSQKHGGLMKLFRRTPTLKHTLNQSSLSKLLPPKSQCHRTNNLSQPNSVLDISRCHHGEIQGLCLQQVFNQPKNKDANPCTPFTLGIGQAHVQPPQGTNRSHAHPHSREQVFYNKHRTAASVAPAQTSCQGHHSPKVEICLSMVFLKVKHTCYFLQAGLSGGPGFSLPPGGN